jgi:hypothetical protein
MAALVPRSYIDDVALRSPHQRTTAAAKNRECAHAPQPYFATLLLLQFALIGCVAPPLSRLLRSHAPRALRPAAGRRCFSSWRRPATSPERRFACLSRHRTRASPAQRSIALSRLAEWATVLASCGGSLAAAGCRALALLSALPADARMTAMLVARPVVAGGLAVACGRRAVRRAAAAKRRAGARERRSEAQQAGRIEVTHPPELRTRVA